MSGQVWLNGLDLRRAGFFPAGFPRFLEGPARTVSTVALPGRMGGLFVDGGTVALRELSIEGTFVRATAAAREAAEAVVREALGTGLVEIRARDARGGIRVAYGLPSGVASHEPIGPLFRTRGTRYALPLLCEDATWRAEEPTIVALGATPVTIALGSAPTAFIARAHGPSTGTLLQFHTAGGLLTTQMQLGDLTADEVVEVNGGEETVTEWDLGVQANGLHRIVDDPFPGYGLTPADGATQTVTLVGGATGELWYWRRDR